MTDWKPEPSRVRVLADRLCWLKEGDPGLRRRHGMYSAFRQSSLVYYDEYDQQAGQLAPTLLKPLAVFTPPEPPGWKQPNLFGV